MTLDEFFEELKVSSKPKMWTLEYDGACIRTGIKSKAYYSCPLTYLANLKSDPGAPKFEVHKWSSAARVLGLTAQDGLEVMRAADLTMDSSLEPVFQKSIREKLLKATGLPKAPTARSTRAILTPATGAQG